MAEELSECPICGAELEKGATECPECGEPLKEEEMGVFECPICGVEVEEGATECPECGEPLEEDEEMEKALERLTKIPGLGRKRAIKLYEEGFKTLEDIVEAGMEGLAGIEQIGPSTASKMIDEAEEIIEEEAEEEIEESEEVEVLESITEDFEGIVEEEEEDFTEGPNRVIVGDEIQENLGDLVPVLSAFLIPLFLLILVASEFVVVLLDYTSVFPAQSLYYLTPLPFAVSSWIGSITLSFLVVLALFILTLKGYDFNTVFRVKIDKSMILLSAVLSIIISVSLIVHVYYSQMYSGIVLTYVLLVLSLFMLVNQLELIRKKYSLFPRIEEKKACIECGGVMDLDLENCPQCGSEIEVLEEKISKVEKGFIWTAAVSLFQPKPEKEPEAPMEEMTLEAEGGPEEVPEWEDEEEIPEWEAPEEEVTELEEEEEVPEWEEPEEEVPEFEEEEEVPEWEEEEEIPEKELPEEEATELEEEVTELEEILEVEEEPEELPEEEEIPEEEGGIGKSFSGIANSIRGGLSSTVSFFKDKLGSKKEKSPEEIEEEVVEDFEEEGICPTCGAVIPSDSEECPECGEELEPPEEPEEEEIETGSALEDLERALEEVEEETESVVFVCPICDAELKEDVDECPECGTAFVEEEEETDEEGEEGIAEESLKESEEE